MRRAARACASCGCEAPPRSRRAPRPRHVLVLDPFPGCGWRYAADLFHGGDDSGFRFNAIATPNTVAGRLRSVKIRHGREAGARTSYSNINSTRVALARPRLRTSTNRKASEARSPSMVSPPSSKFTTNWTAGRPCVSWPPRIGRVAPVAEDRAGEAAGPCELFLEPDLLRTLPQHGFAERGSRGQGDEVIAGGLAVACSRNARRHRPAGSGSR